MLHCPTNFRMSPYSDLKQFEGKGNYAIWKYYKLPYSFFYRKKLKMIVSLMPKGKIYRNILDYGSGPGIFEEELNCHALSVKKFEIGETIDPRWRFEAIVCASVLEFTDLKTTIMLLKNLLMPQGVLYVGSPMQTFLSKTYFKAIGDKNRRRHHDKIIHEISRELRIEKYITWMNLYFAIRASKN